MKKFLAAAGIGAALAAGALVGPGTAHADFLWATCGDQHSGIVINTPTSCPFAHNVANAYLYGASNLTNVWSPVTRSSYDMSYCTSGYVAYMASGGTKIVSLCQGGNDANVIVY
jgi:hypothetical protein